MSFSTSGRVAALIPNLLNNASDFGGLPANTIPGSAQLVQMQSSGCAAISGILQARGYGIPASGTGFYDYLAHAESVFVAMMAESARGSPRISPGERTRYDIFRRQWEDCQKFLQTADLSPILSQTGRWYVGGISESEVDSVDSDTDLIPMRFSRGKFDNPDISAS